MTRVRVFGGVVEGKKGDQVLNVWREVRMVVWIHLRHVETSLVLGDDVRHS